MTVPNKKNIGLLLGILLGANLILALYQIFSSSLNMADDVEHLRAAYFVSLGDIPYRDFFEHHHPLLWYILAPLIAILPHRTVIALYAGRIICFAVSLLAGWFVYKTEKKFIGGKICALLCLCLYFLAFDDIVFSGLFQVKPDILQRCCFFGGLYYLFNYFRYRHFRQLQIATVLFTLAFLFLQTIVFDGALLAIPVLYFIYKNPQKLPDLLKAAVVPLIMLSVCAYGLWQSGSFGAYYELNWQLNGLFTKIWFHPTILPFLPYVPVLIVAFASIFWLFRHQKGNIYRLTLIILFLGEFIRCVCIAKSVQHYLLTLIFAAMIAAPMIYKKAAWRKAFFGFAFLCVIIGMTTLSRPLTKSVPFALLDKTEYGLTITPGGVFAKRPSYYWSHIPAETIHDIYFHSVPDYDINRLNEQYPQELVYYFPQWSQFEYKTLADSLNREQQEILKKHYIGLDALQNYRQINAFAYVRQ